MSKGFGGLELYVLKVTRYLAQSGNEYCVLTRCGSFLAKKLAENNIQSGCFSYVFRHLPLISAFQLARYLEKNQIDIIHIHWGKDLFLAVLAKIFSRRKIRLVYTRQMALTREKKDAYHRFLYRNIDAYLVITQVLFEQAIRYLPLTQDKIHILYYGVPEPEIQKFNCENFYAENRIPEDGFRLAIFGRVEHLKGQHLLVEAVKKLRDRGLNIYLAVIGHIMDESYFAELQQAIKVASLENNIHYLGFHNNPVSIMPCFDAVVLATKCETFGLVLAEAMRAGTAVIGSDCGGVPEIIRHGKTGLLFESGNADDLAVQIEKLATDVDYCKKVAMLGKKYADMRFDEEKHFSKLVSIFSDLMK